MTLKRRRGAADVSDAEWSWLVCARDANPFHGLEPDRFTALWERYEPEVRAAWEREGYPPSAVKYHPAGCQQWDCAAWVTNDGYKNGQVCWRCELAFRGEKVPPEPPEFDIRHVLVMSDQQREEWNRRRRVWLYGEAPRL